MAVFTGTNGSDTILRNALSLGVVTDPAGQTGTQNGEINEVYGYAGDDVLEAGDGDGFGGGNSLYGGEGADTLTGGSGYDFLFGDDGDDVIYGGADAFSSDSYYGGAGNDRIYGSTQAANSFDGGTGVDTMVGGFQNDYYAVDNPDDRIVEVNDAGSVDEVNVSAPSYRLPTNVENMFFYGSSGFRGYGNDRDNVISSGDGNDVISGDAGNDTLTAGAGADKIRGEAGDDVLTGSSGYEAVGKDSLFGGSGADTLYGGEDADLLYGGRGYDTFLFSGSWESTPTRRDVLKAEAGAAAFDGAGRATCDLIDLASIDADLTNNPSNGPDPFAFGSVRKGGLSLVNVGSNTLVRGNLDDDASFEFQILIEDGAVKASTYTADDFILSFA
jgi:Ca2+-binding RTX toxin-like protein